MVDSHPKLRPIHAQPIVANGQPGVLLQDPLRLADKALVIPRALMPVLQFSDGTRNLNELYASLMIRAGIRLSIPELERILERFDEVFLLDNERSAAEIEATVGSYREAPFRPPALAGDGYPAEPEELTELLDGYLTSSTPAGGAIRGLVSPHIDYERGGPVYAEVWHRATRAARAAQVVLILGTDHNGGCGRLTLTGQNYATPYGVLPTDTATVEAVAEAIGHEAAFADEVNHRYEHSIELAAVWLHYARGGEPCAVVPILMGSFQHFVDGEAQPADDPIMVNAVRALRTALEGRNALVVASADLAHIGPAFDDPRPVDIFGMAQLKAKDMSLIDTICAGDAEAFFDAIRQEGNRRNICGLAPIYLMLRLLEDGRGELAGYDRCPADIDRTSFVSICGVVLD